ncbi:hypothetical protein [Streptomyces virginiae]|uniref:hypothetical protein n=1 Tax=Streptomyces virginiae TaxID=1961 RepID=UPI003424ADFE
MVRQTSQQAAYWHSYARELPPPPTPEERAETERVARQAEEQAAQDRRLHHERWEWGGRLPSEALRAVSVSAHGLLGFDSDLAHTLDAAGSEVQRAVASLTAGRACEAAGLIAVAWVSHAVTALVERRPLPPPFDDTDRMWETLRSDPQVPSRSVLAAVHPERPPYSPLTPQEAWGTRIPAPKPREGRERRSLGRGLEALLQTAPADDDRVIPAENVWHATVTVHAPGTSRGPRLISQPHFALPAVLAAAESDPLKAALDAVWHALNTYGEHYPRLLTEIRAVCVNQVEEQADLADPGRGQSVRFHRSLPGAADVLGEWPGEP